MKIYKFGGASVKDAEGVKNLLAVLQKVGFQDILIVVSAMGKMTNAFERLTDAYYYNKEDVSVVLDEIRRYHHKIINDLYAGEGDAVINEIELVFMNMTGFMIQNKSRDYDYVYDQLVSCAELISTKIISQYLNDSGINNTWIDVRTCVKTNSDFRDAKVDWEETNANIHAIIQPQKLYVTQGFIARDKNGNTTTLGREGSDYSAGIFAYCLDATELVIWKDVPGVLNADPRFFEQTQLLNQVSYTEAIELAFYGASVIHPKTLQPLQKKEIPLYVRSFKKPKEKGTAVTRGARIIPETPCFIVKSNQILLSVSSLDFSFIVEQNISMIFGLLHEYKMKVNLIQNSAISFSVCLEDKYYTFDKLTEALRSHFSVEFYKEVTLHTIRHFDEQSIAAIEEGNKVLLKQLSKETVQIVIQ